jgi:hypothetical protein
MMDELVQEIVEKTGLSEPIARKAAQIVIGYLKSKLPPTIAAQIDAVLAGSDISDSAGDIAKGLGGMLGRK